MSAFLIPPGKVEPCPGTHVPGKGGGSVEGFGADWLRKVWHQTIGGELPSLKVEHDGTLAGHDAYVIEVTPAEIKLRHATPAALQYACLTLADYVEYHGVPLPCVRIADASDFKRRAIYLDCSRGKVPTLDTLKAIADRLARWRINELQLYIENVFTFAAHPEIGNGFDPFTPQEIEELQSWCAERHIRLVGSLASFGHLETVLALPAYRHLAELPGAHGWPGGTTLCPTDPGSLALMQELYAEFVPLFDAVDFNLCGDETWELGKGRSRERAEEIGVGKLYAEFIQSLSETLTQDYGKRVNMWADIALKHPDALAYLPRELVLCHWCYGAGPEAEARFAQAAVIREMGYPLMVCPGTNVWQTHGGLYEQAVWNISQFIRTGRMHAAEGVLLTDWGDCGHRNMLGVSWPYMAFGAAQAWNSEALSATDFFPAFFRRELGQDHPDLLDAFRTLGMPPADTPHVLYHGLVEPERQAKDPFDGIPAHAPVRMGAHNRVLSFERASRETLAPVLERPDNMPGLDAGALPEDEFERAVLSEWALAWEMDRLAARHLAGQHGPDWKAAYERMQTRFAEAWLARNKPSRLEDNRVLLRHVLNGGDGNG